MPRLQAVVRGCDLAIAAIRVLFTEKSSGNSVIILHSTCGIGYFCQFFPVLKIFRNAFCITITKLKADLSSTQTSKTHV